MLISLGIGAALIALRSVLKLKRTLVTDLALTGLGAVVLLVWHLVSPNLFGLDPFLDLGFEIAKHALELIVILMLLVAF